MRLIYWVRTMNKKQILKQCEILLKDKKKFDKASDKFKKKYPQSYTHGHFVKKINGTIFIKKYENKLYFYKPTCIRIERKELLINCESWSRTFWRSSGLNGITLKEFKKLIEINNDYVIEQCKKNKEDYLVAIEKLEKDTIKKINDASHVEEKV